MYVPEVADHFANQDMLVFLCAKVVLRAPILHVSHDLNGDWQFLCGGEHGDGGEGMPRLAHLEQVLAQDPSIWALADLAQGFVADRDAVDAEWRMSEIPSGQG